MFSFSPSAGSVENPHPSASLRAGFLAQRTREKWGTRIFIASGGILVPLRRLGLFGYEGFRCKAILIVRSFGEC